MRAFTKHEGLAVGINRANIDTDQIIPKQFLKKIERSGFGVHLFHDWRFLDDAGKQENPEFILNQSVYRSASVLVARDNFGCGSSREHAPWALDDYGFRAIIAPSFADIFYNNCFKNGILPVVLKLDEIEEIFQYLDKNKETKITVDLGTMEVSLPSGKKYIFSVDFFRKECLYKGLDDIGLTLMQEDKISKYESEGKQSKPWL